MRHHPQSDTKIRILFVCLGNICRSPAAEGIMRHQVEMAGLVDYIEIDSAGIGSWHVGQLPDRRMRRQGERHGYHFDSLARQLTAADFDRFDYIIGMDEENIRDIHRRANSKNPRAKVLCMADFLRSHPHEHEIPDPYYGGESDFEHVVCLLEDACEGLLEFLSTKQ